MIYLSSFKLSDRQVKNPNIYPYNVFRGKYIEPFVFTPITVFMEITVQANQVALAEEINKMARLLECQFIVATHSPFMLGTLNAKIYNLDTQEYDVAKWSELENVRYFYDFFVKHKKEFE